jgi:hypothetical protein
MRVVSMNSVDSMEEGREESEAIEQERELDTTEAVEPVGEAEDEELEAETEEESEEHISEKVEEREEEKEDAHKKAKRGKRGIKK